MPKYRKSHNRKGIFKHIPQTLVTKFVAKPYFKQEAKEVLPIKTFEVVDYLKNGVISPSKEEWDEAVEKAQQDCEKFISKNATNYFQLRKGLKTSFRVRINHSK